MALSALSIDDERHVAIHVSLLCSLRVVCGVFEVSAHEI